MSRQAARESVMKMIFESEFNDAAQRDASLELIAPVALTRGDRAFMDECAQGVFSHIDELDAVIARHARDWSIERIAKVDKSILRLAVYEMTYADTPEPVAINEALNMARVYSTPESVPFINGILGAYSRGRLQKPEAAQ